MSVPQHLPRPLPKPELSNIEAFGDLVREWSRTPSSIPVNLGDLKMQLANRGIMLTLPAGMVDLKVITAPKDTFILTIPHQDSIQDCQDYLDNQLPELEIYPVSSYYTDAFKCDMDINHRLDHKKMTRSQREEFMTKRIGEYSMNICM